MTNIYDVEWYVWYLWWIGFTNKYLSQGASLAMRMGCHDSILEGAARGSIFCSYWNAAKKRWSPNSWRNPMHVLYEPQLCLDFFNPMGIAVVNMAVNICHARPTFACLRQGEAPYKVRPPGFWGILLPGLRVSIFWGTPKKLDGHGESRDWMDDLRVSRYPHFRKPSFGQWAKKTKLSNVELEGLTLRPIFTYQM